MYRFLAAAALLSLGATAAFSQTGGRPLSTTLIGAAEVPGPGDPDGRGMARITVNPGKGEICYRLSASMIAPAAAAHIHEAAVGAAGPVRVTLMAPTSGTSEGCAAVSRELAQGILRMPSNYYVNVHNAEYPAGAIRGQLRK